MRTVEEIQNGFIGGKSLWDQSDLQRLIDEKVEERYDLEYKAAATLVPNNADKITREVSAMANSAGGVVIFGVAEPREIGARHYPDRLDPVNRSSFSRESLTQVLARIQPVIDGVRIYPVRIGEDDDAVAYVVVVPQSSTAHQATDRKYYYRNNDASEAMHDYQIRDVMNRLQYPKLSMDFEIHEKTLMVTDEGERIPHYRLSVRVSNEGKRMAKFVNCLLWIPTELDPKVSGGSRSIHKHREHGGYHHVFAITNLKREKFGPGNARLAPYFDPILPGMSLRLRRIRLHARLDKMDPSGIKVHWEIYGDDAPMVKGSSGLGPWVRYD